MVDNNIVSKPNFCNNIKERLSMASDMKYENGKISSLSIIALEYDNCNSDVEETEVDTNKSENQYKFEEQDKSENQEKSGEQDKSESQNKSNNQEKSGEQDKSESQNKSNNQEKSGEQDKSESQNKSNNQEKSGEQDKSESQNKSNNQDTIPVPIPETLQQYRAIEENILSSCEETDSDDSSSSCDSSSSSSSSSSSTSSDSSSSDYESDDIRTNNNKEKKGNKTSIVKKKKQIENEFDDLPPIEDLKINVPEVLCELLGEVDKIVEQLVIVKPKSNKPALHIDTVLFMEKGGRALGKILDVFGPVSEPNYCIRFNSSEHIQENNIKVGMPVYYCPNTQYTSLIFLHELHKLNSHDAMDDDELPEFSDDEEERAYYEMLKQKNNKDNSDAGTSRKRQCLSSFTQNKPTTEWQSNPWNRNAKFQRKNQKRQQAWRNNSHFNLPQYEPSSYNDSWLQYQSNMHWSPVPRNIHPMFNGPHAEYRPPFNITGLSPVQQLQFSNGSSDAEQYSQGTTPNSQCNNMQSQYPRIPFGASPRFHSTFPSFPMNYPQPPTTSFSCLNMPYPSARPPMHTNAPWSSLSPPPPPPSTDSTIID